MGGFLSPVWASVFLFIKGKRDLSSHKGYFTPQLDYWDTVDYLVRRLSHPPSWSLTNLPEVFSDNSLQGFCVLA